MTTDPIYYDHSYQAEAEASILHLRQKGSKHQVILDGTIFYPGGGGQLFDVGEITGENGGLLRVERVEIENGRIIHEGIVEGVFAEFETVQLRLNWNRRLEGMRLHTAGHLLHQAFVNLRPTGLVPRKAEHHRQPFVEYHGALDISEREKLEASINELVLAGLPVVMRETTYDELIASCRFVPPNLPRNKPLRVVRIGEGEGRVVVPKIQHTADQTGSRVHYHIENP